MDGPEALPLLRRLRQAWTDAGLAPSAMRLVLSRYDGRRKLDRELLRQTTEAYGSSLLPQRIRESVAMRESAICREPLVYYAPHHPITDDVRCLSREVARG